MRGFELQGCYINTTGQTFGCKSERDKSDCKPLDYSREQFRGRVVIEVLVDH